MCVYKDSSFIVLARIIMSGTAIHLFSSKGIRWMFGLLSEPLFTCHLIHHRICIFHIFHKSYCNGCDLAVLVFKSVSFLATLQLNNILNKCVLCVCVDVNARFDNAFGKLSRIRFICQIIEDICTHAHTYNTHPNRYGSYLL